MGHVTPVRTYLLVYVALLVLTAATVGAAFLPLGPLSVVAALAIAGVKATLVLLWFMHMRESSRVTWILAAAGLAWLLLLILPVIVDYLTRGWVLAPKGW
ncbi:MAG TPA: cytochrome C oxidase subunit IV family protein [Planctomycetota bacterium]|nr:cytochrome C oxidase subunit IV family protein [Planctomycetota bacterium]